ncbi:MAG: type III pantothenate kinase [Lachnospiraceae bacterium]|nr:type III pantothenate kinase [Lachnospiraceae bacterium]
MDKKQVLAVDIGNTNICVGCFDEKEIYFTERISTDMGKTELEYAVLIKTILELRSVAVDSVSGAIISSVVPPLTHIVKNAIRKVIKQEPMVVGAGIKTGLNILIDDPATLGADLVVDSVAALGVYGAPNIVIDMGTATTVAAIDKDKNYIGGVIFPGVNVSLQSLVSGTAQLPGISLSTPKRYIGRNTGDAMKSGIIYGEASRLDGMIDRFEEELGYKVTVIATGGLAGVIVPHCKHEIIQDQDLMLKGLKIIYEKNAK